MSKKMEENKDTKYFEVNRGIKMEPVIAVARWWSLLHGEKTFQNELELAGQTQKIKDIKGDYAGVYFSNQ